jgi:signal transduction histidine kinase
MADDAADGALWAAQRNLEALDIATRAIAGAMELEAVLQLIADNVRTLIGSKYAAIGVVDAAGYIERFITSGISAEGREQIGEPPRGHGLLGLLIREGRPFRIARIADHPDSAGFPPNHPPMVSFLGVPVTVAGRSLGNLYLTEKDGAEEFSEDDQRLVEMFALHAGIATERTRLNDEVRRLAIVDERQRISMDLHDGIIQSLYGVVLSLDLVPELMDDDRADATIRIDRAIDRLNLTIRDIRSFILELGATSTSGAGLVAGLAALAEALRMDGLIEVEVVLPEAGGVEAVTIASIAVETADQLLQMSRETLSNVARHAGATRASVTIHDDGRITTLSIADNGHGFDVSAARSPEHFGLINLTERAASIGATIEIDSRPDRGTRVTMVVPHS